MKLSIRFQITLLLGLSIVLSPTYAGADCNEIPAGVTPNFLPFRADPNGDCTIDYRDFFELALDWQGGSVNRGYRVDADYLLQTREGRSRFQSPGLTGDVNLDGVVDNSDFDFFLLNQDRGLSDCACGDETDFAWFPYTMDLDGDGWITRADTGLFNCILSKGGTCTPTPTFTPTSTFTPSHSPTITPTPTHSRTPTVTVAPTSSPTSCLYVVAIPDEGLESAVRSRLSKPSGDLTACDMESLLTLGLSSGQVSDLEGLQFATNLENFTGPVNRISDLSPLGSLLNLKTLHLANNRISDIAPLLGLPNLLHVYLQFNPLSNTAQCHQIPALVARGVVVQFDLTVECPTSTPTETFTPTSTPTPTATCKVVTIADINLEREIRLLLNKPGGEITECDLEPIREVDFKSASITDLEGLQFAANLRELRLDDNRITDIGPLSNLTKLEELNLVKNQISEISPLASLINLTDLTLNFNPITDLAPIAGLPKLKFLNVGNTDLTDIGPVSSLLGLEVLLAGNNEIIDLAAGASLPNLFSVGLEDNEISDIQPLVDNAALGLGADIRLSGNPLSAMAQCIQVPALLNRFVEVQYDQTIACP